MILLTTERNGMERMWTAAVTSAARGITAVASVESTMDYIRFSRDIRWHYVSHQKFLPWWSIVEFRQYIIQNTSSKKRRLLEGDVSEAWPCRDVQSEGWRSKKMCWEKIKALSLCKRNWNYNKNEDSHLVGAKAPSTRRSTIHSGSLGGFYTHTQARHRYPRYESQ